MARSSKPPRTPAGVRVKRLDGGSLRALAHPLRVRILSVLRGQGRATATILGERLGESSGATSYHLRVLAEHGFVVDEPTRNRGRERWWRAAQDMTAWQPPPFFDDPHERGFPPTPVPSDSCCLRFPVTTRAPGDASIARRAGRAGLVDAALRRVKRAALVPHRVGAPADRGAHAVTGPVARRDRHGGG